MGIENTGGSLRAALEGAWEARSEGSDETEPVEQTSQAEETPTVTEQGEEKGAAPEVDTAPSATSPDSESKPDRPRDESGKFTKTPKVKEGGQKPPEKSAPVPGNQKAPQTRTPPPTPGASSPTKAPAGWKPAEREAFSKAPPEVQSAVARREREFAMAMQEAAPHREAAEWFSKATAPYEGMLRSQGGDPRATTENLWRTWAALNFGTPQGREQLIAQMIQAFRVDPGGIAAHLQGQPSQTPQQQFDPNQFAQQIEQRVMGTFQQQQARAIEAHHAKRLADFEAKAEFIDDVRPAMAKLIEAGLADDFEDAYNKAVAMDPEVSRTIAARGAAVTQANARASTQRARAASTSLKSSPAGPTLKPQPNTPRGSIEAAWEQLHGTRR